jgi:hypothetical protein
MMLEEYNKTVALVPEKLRLLTVPCSFMWSRTPWRPVSPKLSWMSVTYRLQSVYERLADFKILLTKISDIL